MSLQGLNNSDLFLSTNTGCSNFTTIDLSNASSTLVNAFMYDASDSSHLSPLSSVLDFYVLCFFAVWTDH